MQDGGFIVPPDKLREYIVFLEKFVEQNPNFILIGDAKDHLTKEVDDAVKAAGISTGTLKRCKAELKENGVIRYRCEGYGQAKTFYMCLDRS